LNGKKLGALTHFGAKELKLSKLDFGYFVVELDKTKIKSFLV
jgi:hypothetical protein